MRRYHRQADAGDIRPLPVIAGEDVEPKWEVEAIEGERWFKSEIQYLVHWKGYTERTWEPESYLEHAPQMVADWRSTRPDGDELKAEAREGKVLW